MRLTGIKNGELLGVRRSDVDLKTRILYVRRTKLIGK